MHRSASQLQILVLGPDQLTPLIALRSRMDNEPTLGKREDRRIALDTAAVRDELQGRSTTLGMYDAERLVGVVTYGYFQRAPYEDDAPCWYFKGLAVDGRYRRKKIGLRLVVECVRRVSAYLGDTGCAIATCYRDGEPNTAARLFYDRLGFRDHPLEECSEFEEDGVTYIERTMGTEKGALAEWVKRNAPVPAPSNSPPAS